MKMFNLTSINIVLLFFLYFYFYFYFLVSNAQNVTMHCNQEITKIWLENQFASVAHQTSNIKLLFLFVFLNIKQTKKKKSIPN